MNKPLELVLLILVLSSPPVLFLTVIDVLRNGASPLNLAKSICGLK